MAIHQWLDWVGGPVLAYLPLSSFHSLQHIMIHGIFAIQQLCSFLSIDVFASFWDLFVADMLVSLQSDLDAIFDCQPSPLSSNTWFSTLDTTFPHNLSMHPFLVHELPWITHLLSHG